MKRKITLGTANFGLAYGIANQRMLSRREAFLVLEKALETGVSSVDTARGYGDAERVVGAFFRQHGKCFEVVTKLPAREYASPNDVAEEIEKSLEALETGFIDVLLLHSFETFQRFGEVLMPTLEEYAGKGRIGRYGVSIYHPHEAEALLRHDSGVTAVQFPLNIFDRRFLKDDLPRRLRNGGIRLDARSVFLQGLFFLPPQTLSAHFDPAKAKLKRLSGLALAHGLTVGATALLFAASCDIDHVVLGVDSAEQLETNLKWLGNGGSRRFAQVSPGLDELEVTAEDVILPYRWKN